MIIIEKKNSSSDKYADFDAPFEDGRMTEISDGKIYRLREAILLSKRLGRPLTSKEMQSFEID